MIDLEMIILKNLLHNETFIRKSIPFIKKEYFQDSFEQNVFGIIKDYFHDYNNRINLDQLLIEIKEFEVLEEDEEIFFDKISSYFREGIKSDPLDWVLNKTEEFCKERAAYLAVEHCVSLLGKNAGGEMVDVLEKALAVSFQTDLGMDYVKDAEQRYDFLHNKETKIPFGMEMFDKITKGGIEKKTLNLIMGAVGSGKSLFMINMAANQLKLGYKVLYITLEMAVEKMGERADVILMNMNLPNYYNLSKKDYLSKFYASTNNAVENKFHFIEQPPGVLSAINIQHILDEFKSKKNFIPDVIYVDYLNLMASSLVSRSGNGGMYSYLKSIAEELRAIGVKNDLAIVSATQLNREGAKQSDPDGTNTSESYGIPATADFMTAIMKSEELDEISQIGFKTLKSRYNNVDYFKYFHMGIDLEQFRLYDIDSSEYTPKKENKNSEITPSFKIETASKTIQDKYNKVKNVWT